MCSCALLTVFHSLPACRLCSLTENKWRQTLPLLVLSLLLLSPLLSTVICLTLPLTHHVLRPPFHVLDGVCDVTRGVLQEYAGDLISFSFIQLSAAGLFRLTVHLRWVSQVEKFIYDMKSVLPHLNTRLINKKSPNKSTFFNWVDSLLLFNPTDAGLVHQFQSNKGIYWTLLTINLLWKYKWDFFSV